jgi:hypothetical protein
VHFLQVKSMSIFAVFSICAVAHTLGLFSFAQFSAAVKDKKATNVLG